MIRHSEWWIIEEEIKKDDFLVYLNPEDGTIRKIKDDEIPTLQALEDGISGDMIECQILFMDGYLQKTILLGDLVYVIGTSREAMEY